ncbi:NACHT, LRR and PYD domains-containing protein 12 isoform X2 [Pseudoliparis swirei]|uniref:NACHT, LRR and PYD domains-containing protein 12 isoform X2 n=1 Tax=Pseudoliparis swirei TaxID=2059687 RepID=UPI0024BED467|nr:NACHT, LRR and PYD domains-containing protein 12 isoform X2 [Pseudoliparis swirei]
MDEDAALRSKVTSTLLLGEPPVSVVNDNKYISPPTAGDADHDRPSLDAAIHAALSGGPRTVVLLGPEGSGKTTALEKLVVGWARGEHLQNFSFVFHLRFRELSSLDGTPLSLETLMRRHGGRHLPPEAVRQVLRNPESALFVFDDLDRCDRGSDPSAVPPCSDPGRAAPVSGLVAGLFGGSLLKGVAVAAATRPTESREFFPSGARRVQVSGFLKPQREAYFRGFFPDDPAAAAAASAHMESTLGFYEFCTSPRFCWTVCSVYKSLMDAGAELPETLSQLYAGVLVRLTRALRLNEARGRALVSALGEMASRCLVGSDSSCAEEEMDSFGFRPFLKEAGAFLRVDDDGGDRSDGRRRVFSFHSRPIQEFFLAAAFLWDPSSGGVEETLAKHEGRAEFLDVFLSGLSQPLRRRPLEAALGAPNAERVADFNRWFRSDSREALAGCRKDRHLRCFRMLLEAGNESLVKEVVDAAARIGISYGDVSLRDCAALGYVVSRLGGVEHLNLYRTGHLTGAQAETLAPAMRLSREINLNSSSLSSAAATHLASALSGGATEELDLSQSALGDDTFKTLCAGLRNCKLRTLKLHNCDLTAASVEALSAALCSGHSELRKVDLTRNLIGERGVEALSKSLQHPLCTLTSLNLFDCELTGACCAHFSEALMSSCCSLTELDLSVNDLRQEGALLLCRALRRPGCPIQKLSLQRCQLTAPVFEELSSVLRGGASRLTSLSVGLNAVGDRGVKHLWDAVAHPSCLLEELDVEMTGLTDAGVQDLCGALRTSSTLRSLELRNNAMTDAAVPALVRAARDSDSMLEMNLKYNDFSEDVFELMDECEKIRY